jgi:hypothetical protein
MDIDSFSLHVVAPFLLFILCAVLPKYGSTSDLPKYGRPSDEATDYITLLEAVPYFLIRPHKNTVVRWADRGVYGVKLKTIRYGGKRLTRKVWIEEFNKAMIGASPDPYAADSAPTTSHLAAEATLDVMLGVVSN